MLGFGYIFGYIRAVVEALGLVTADSTAITADDTNTTADTF